MKSKFKIFSSLSASITLGLMPLSISLSSCSCSHEKKEEENDYDITDIQASYVDGDGTFFLLDSSAHYCDGVIKITTSPIFSGKPFTGIKSVKIDGNEYVGVDKAFTYTFNFNEITTNKDVVKNISKQTKIELIFECIPITDVAKWNSFGFLGTYDYVTDLRGLTFKPNEYHKIEVIPLDPEGEIKGFNNIYFIDILDPKCNLISLDLFGGIEIKLNGLTLTNYEIEGDRIFFKQQSGKNYISLGKNDKLTLEFFTKSDSEFNAKNIVHFATETIPDTDKEIKIKVKNRDGTISDMPTTIPHGYGEVELLAYDSQSDERISYADGLIDIYAISLVTRVIIRVEEKPDAEGVIDKHYYLHAPSDITSDGNVRIICDATGYWSTWINVRVEGTK